MNERDPKGTEPAARNWNGEFFTKEDFKVLRGIEMLCQKHLVNNCHKQGCEGEDAHNRDEIAAHTANAILREEIEKLETVYGPTQYFVWPEGSPIHSTWVTAEGRFPSKNKNSTAARDREMTPEELKRARAIARNAISRIESEPIPAPFEERELLLARAFLYLSERNDELWGMVDSCFPEGLDGYQIIKKKGTSNAAEELVKDYIYLRGAVEDAFEILSSFCYSNDKEIFNSIEPGLTWLSKYGEKKCY